MLGIDGEPGRGERLPEGDPHDVSESATRLPDLADEELMGLYARNEEAAFEILLSRYRRPLFTFLCRYLGRLEDAEDVFQEVFYEVIRARARFRPRYKFSAWLFRIARNRAVDRLRRNGLREMESLDDPVDSSEQAGESRLNMVPGADPDPEQMARSLQLQDALEAALRGIPSEQSEVFWLKEKSGLTLAEIAHLTDVCENTVKSRLRYALESVRENLTRRGFVL